MPNWKRVSIIGVGLIGGSIGMALRKRNLAQRVVGYSRRPETRAVAMAKGAIDQAAENIGEAAEDADLVIACAPVQWIPDHLREAAATCRDGALLTDVGSTKEPIVRALADLPSRVRFCAAHPLAGSEKSGPEHAQEDLFADRTVVLTPGETTPRDALDEVTSLWTALDARTIVRDPAAHDRALAATSHLPHVVASALAAATDPDDLELTATGWRDTTRVASGDTELWRQILSDNRRNIVSALDRFDQVVSQFRDALASDDQDRIVQLLEQGKKNRDALGS